MHHVIKLINGSIIPEPRNEWKELVLSIKNDLDHAKKNNISLKNYKILDYFLVGGYKEEEYIQELPTHLIEFLIINNSLPNDTNILSTKSIQGIEKLLTGLLKQVSELNKQYQNMAIPGRLKLFEDVMKGNVEAVKKYITPENYKAYHIYPMHILDLSHFKEFEKAGFSAFSPDKFGRAPLELAMENRRFELAFYLLEKYFQKDEKLPQGFNINTVINDQGHTLLISAILAKKNEKFILKMINDYGANVNIRDSHGQLPLAHALDNNLSLPFIQDLFGKTEYDEDCIDKLSNSEEYSKILTNPSPRFNYP